MTLKKTPKVKKSLSSTLKTNIDCFNAYLKEVLSNTAEPLFQDNEEFRAVLFANSAFFAQKLYNAYLQSINTNDEVDNNNLNVWVDSLMESLVCNFILAMTFIDLTADSSKMSLFSILHETLNSTPPSKESKTIH